MTNICELEVSNRKNAMVVVANRVLDPKGRSIVPFEKIRQLEDAMAAERNKIIRLETPIPKEVFDEYPWLNRDGGKNEDDGKDTEPEESEKPLDPEKPEKPTEPEKPEKPTEPEKNETPENEEKVEEKNTPQPTREEIINFTLKDMRAYLKENEITIEGQSKMNARELTNKMLEHFDYEPLEEENEEVL